MYKELFTAAGEGPQQKQGGIPSLEELLKLFMELTLENYACNQCFKVHNNSCIGSLNPLLCESDKYAAEISFLKKAKQGVFELSVETYMALTEVYERLDPKPRGMVALARDLRISSETNFTSSGCEGEEDPLWRSLEKRFER